ncbi:Ff.00g064770.m01.CDS01 [Fusarium sp. VM40]|nr:Ff.00g064770.m01.CDS01 [Fusarium sp. VM40]
MDIKPPSANFQSYPHHALFIDLLENPGLQAPASAESATRRPMATSKTLDRIQGNDENA